MYDKLVAVEIPPGIVKNGTMYERAGRWVDGDLVRFLENGIPVAVAGAVTLTVSPAPPGGIPCGAFAFNDSTRPVILVGTSTKLYELEYAFNYPSSSHAVTDVTPGGGLGSTATWWQFDRIGSDCIGVNSLGKVYKIPDAVAATDITPDAFKTYTGVVTTDEGFLVLLRYGSTGPSVQWASQGTDNVWTPATTNSAGSLDVRSAVPLTTAKRVQGTTLIWTSENLYELSYVGAPLYYGVRQRGGNCGVIGPNAVAVAGERAFWMGSNGFYQYNGFVQPLPCDIAESVFGSGNVNVSAGGQVFCIVIGSQNEIWWFYPVSGSTTPTKVAIYNYRNNTWSCGTLTRTAGVGTGAWYPSGVTNNGNWPTVPVLFDANGTTVYEHEQTGTVLAATGAFIESGPFMLDKAAGTRMNINKIIADNVQTSAPETLTVYAGNWPKEAETSSTPTIPAAGGEVDVRINARYVRFRHALTRFDSRVGSLRLGIESGSKR